MNTTQLPRPAAAPALHHAHAGEAEREAAALAQPKVGSLNAAVIALLQAHPDGLTATETLDLYVQAHHIIGLYSVAPRLSQLERLGWCEKNGTRTRDGERRRTIYRLTDEARQQLSTTARRTDDCAW
jgi:DNA-binding PadR family transcriptional regulator